MHITRLHGAGAIENFSHPDHAEVVGFGAAAQLELPIFDPTEPRILPQDHRAWFTVNWMSREGRLNRQKAFEADELETVFRLTAGQPNVYSSQCFLDRPVRRHAFVRYSTHAYVDLDTYRIPHLADLSPDARAWEVRRHCDGAGIPQPSAIFGSGRGLYAKWYWRSPVGREGVGSLVGANRALVRLLADFGADPKATDATRILRINGTENTGARRLVELLHLEQRDGHTITYDADAFARNIAPGTSEAPEPSLLLPAVAELDREARPDRSGCTFSREGWHWAIVEDCRTLAGLRWGGTVPHGWRDIFGHVMACQLTRIFRVGTVFPEIAAHVSTILPADYVRHELAADCSTLLRRAREVGGRGVYQYRKATLIERLQITPAEERAMRALISDAEGRRRDTVRQREQRWAAGRMEREKWLANNSAARERPWEAEGISRATWYRRASTT